MRFSLRSLLFVIALSTLFTGVIWPSAQPATVRAANMTKFGFQIGASAISAIRDFESQVGRPIKQPKSLPFAVKANLASSQEIPGGPKVLQIDYVGDNDWATITVIPGNVMWFSSKYQITDVNLANGTKAQYMDNGTIQQLLWKDGGFTYHLAVGGSKRPVADIIKIAESFAR